MHLVWFPRSDLQFPEKINCHVAVRHQYFFKLEHQYFIIKLIIKFYLIIIIKILRIHRLDKIRQLSKFDNPFNKPRQRRNRKLIMTVSFG
jgi:hypothetical protein